MDNNDFIEWLKSGNNTENKTTGGYLVPDFINVPNVGFISWFFRSIGRFQIRLGLYGNGMLNYEKGCHRENLRERLIRGIKCQN
jgi:hypothetical protein